MPHYKVLMQWTVSHYHPTLGKVETTPVLTETLTVEAPDQATAADAALQQEAQKLNEEILGLREDVSLELAVQQVEPL
jgi:hypothetical protein